MSATAPTRDARSTLLDWQQSLLSALRAPTHEAAAQTLAPWQGAACSKQLRSGLQAYRSNAGAIANRALAAAYPVTMCMLGVENFDALARSLWDVHPPLRGDLTEWGGALAGYLESMTDLVEAEPFLADVVRVEWALHQAGTTEDAEADHASFSLLTHTDPAHLRLGLAPGVFFLLSRWPVVTLVQAHQCAPPELAAAARSLANKEAEAALVWRDGLRPRVRRARPGETEFIDAIQRGQTLLAALDGARDFDFNDWLAPAAHEGLLLWASHNTEKDE